MWRIVSKGIGKYEHIKATEYQPTRVKAYNRIAKLSKQHRFFNHTASYVKDDNKSNK